MMQSIAWALLIAAVLLQLFAARQQMVTRGSTSIGDAKSCQGSRRAYIAGIASALAVGAAGVLAGRQANGLFVIGLGAFVLALIINLRVRRAAMRGYTQSRVSDVSSQGGT